MLGVYYPLSHHYMLHIFTKKKPVKKSASRPRPKAKVKIEIKQEAGDIGQLFQKISSKFNAHFGISVSKNGFCSIQVHSNPERHFKQIRGESVDAMMDRVLQ